MRRSTAGCIVLVAAAVAAGLAPLKGQARPGGRPLPPASSPSIPAAYADVDREAASLPRLHSLVVSQRGTVVFERYYHGFRAGRVANIKSVSKSVMSALVGIAVDRKLLPGVREPIGTFFGDVLRQPADAPKRAITIEDLLTMRSGLESTSNVNYGAWVQSANWVRFVLSRRLLSAPGTEMDYSTGSTHLLSAILTKATRTSTWQFAQRALATPLGFQLAPWTRDPQGIYFGGNEMGMTPRQMLAFGELYLRRGRVGEAQVLPEEWVRTSFVPRGRSRRGDQDGREYGYGWWMRPLAGRQVYYAWGYGGQFILVVPALDAVIVTTSDPTPDDARRAHRRTVLDLIETRILPALGA